MDTRRSLFKTLAGGAAVAAGVPLVSAKPSVPKTYRYAGKFDPQDRIVKFVKTKTWNKTPGYVTVSCVFRDDGKPKKIEGWNPQGEPYTLEMWVSEKPITHEFETWFTQDMLNQFKKNMEQVSMKMFTSMSVNGRGLDGILRSSDWKKPEES